MKVCFFLIKHHQIMLPVLSSRCAKKPSDKLKINRNYQPYFFVLQRIICISANAKLTNNVDYFLSGLELVWLIKIYWKILQTSDSASSAGFFYLARFLPNVISILNNIIKLSEWKEKLGQAENLVKKFSRNCKPAPPRTKLSQLC